MKKILTFCLGLVGFTTWSQNLPVTFKSSKTTVDVEIGGKPFTSYFFPGQDV